ARDITEFTGSRVSAPDGGAVPADADGYWFNSDPPRHRVFDGNFDQYVSACLDSGIRNFRRPEDIFNHWSSEHLCTALGRNGASDQRLSGNCVKFSARKHARGVSGNLVGWNRWLSFYSGRGNYFFFSHKKHKSHKRTSTPFVTFV